VIPHLDLKAQYRTIKTEIDQAIAEVLESGQFILGREVAAFEEEFASYCGGGQAIGANSGTSALHLALLAAGVGPGDEVITTPYTFAATVAAIQYAGAVPVYVDIDPLAFTLDAGLLEAAITTRTKAILPVHLYGQPADMDPILEVARRHGLVVIEDAAQAHGAEYKGRRTGSLADIACFSFYPTKNLGAFGEAGAVVTGNPNYAKTVRLLRNWGESRRYYHDLRGFNYRMEGLQGAILRVKLRHLERWTAARRSIAAFYSERLKDCCATPREMPYSRHVYHVYVIRMAKRDEAARNLTACGVQVGIHYPVPIYLQPAYRDPRYREGAFPVAEAAAREVLSLPLFPEMERWQMEAVCDAVAEQAHLQTGEVSRTA
jgi:dTDP-4-amino-4,6-dideoxygalactose transaminase